MYYSTKTTKMSYTERTHQVVVKVIAVVIAVADLSLTGRASIKKEDCSPVFPSPFFPFDSSPSPLTLSLRRVKMGGGGG